MPHKNKIEITMYTIVVRSERSFVGIAMSSYVIHTKVSFLDTNASEHAIDMIAAIDSENEPTFAYAADMSEVVTRAFLSESRETTNAALWDSDLWRWYVLPQYLKCHLTPFGRRTQRHSLRRFA